ncbi:MAG: carbohydrate-binding domain-containing protein [Eubacterium sp.]|nr:carbohydrate-binding domain-containing protein [Eubacterium sp.]
MKNLVKKSIIAVLAVSMITSLAACGTTSSESTSEETTTETESETTDSETATATSTSAESDSDYFTDRDLEQTADLTDAEYITLSDGTDVEITEEGVYVISGSATDVTITVDCEDENAKVQLVLDGASITNTDMPAIYVKAADKVFVTLADGTSSTLEVTGTYATDDEENFDAVIYAKDDLVLNGTGSLTIVSASGNGIAAKDDLKITGGTYDITASDSALDVNDLIAICDGDITINATNDGLHCEYSDDDTVGEIYISGGTFNITAGDDAIHAQTLITIDGGTFTINAAEGIEATYIIINDGTIDITASDDGINAASKSSAYTATIEVNGGEITISMSGNDTDAMDSNANIIINGGTIDITGDSAFDYDGTGELNGGTVTVNGEEITELTNSMMGGMGGGQMSGAPSDSGTVPSDQGNMSGAPSGGGQMGGGM